MLAERQLVYVKMSKDKHNNLSQVHIFVTLLQFAAFESDAVSIGTKGPFVAVRGGFVCVALRTLVTDEYCRAN